MSEERIKEIIRKAYPRWEAIMVAKKLVDLEWLNNKIEKIEWNPVLNIIIEGLLAGKSLDAIANATQTFTFNPKRGCWYGESERGNKDRGYLSGESFREAIIVGNMMELSVSKEGEIK